MSCSNLIKYYLKVCLFFVPDWAKRGYVKKSNKKSVSKYRERAKLFRVSKDDILGKIGSLDFKSDVIIHFSEINIGKICCTKKELADFLCSRVDTTKHTLLAATLTFSNTLYEYLIKENNRTFDVNGSPIMSGALNEQLAKHENAIRSLHPTHSVVAIGPMADYYTGEHTLDETPFGVHSPWYKIIKNNGIILLIGASKNFSSLHAVEDAIGDCYPFKVYLKRKIECKVTDKNGHSITMITSCHNPIISLRRVAVDDFIDELRRNDFWHSVPVGDSEIVTLDAKGMAQTYLDWLLQGKSIYGNFRVTDRLRNRIEQVKKELKIDMD